jgi:hypothetical protein
MNGGIINSITRLHHVGYFSWVILRCADPWILNIETLYTWHTLNIFNHYIVYNTYSYYNFYSKKKLLILFNSKMKKKSQSTPWPCKHIWVVAKLFTAVSVSGIFPFKVHRYLNNFPTNFAHFNNSTLHETYRLFCVGNCLWRNYEFPTSSS